MSEVVTVKLAALIAESYSAAEAEVAKSYTLNGPALDALVEAGRAILTEFLPVPGACALMSALYAQAIKSRIDGPVHVVAGTLDVDGVRVFGKAALTKGSATFLRSDLDWDGHMWVMVGDRLADISLLRAAKSSGGHPALKRLVGREFRPGAGLAVWSVDDALYAGLRYAPRYVLTTAEIEDLANGGRATLPRA